MAKRYFQIPHGCTKKDSAYYCSWKCFNHRHEGKPKQDIIIPNVGDTIKLISVFGVPSYRNRVGVVKSIDYLGQLHGTWGNYQIIPGEDIYEIIGEKDGKDTL